VSTRSLADLLVALADENAHVQRLEAEAESIEHAQADATRRPQAVTGAASRALGASLEAGGRLDAARSWGAI